MNDQEFNQLLADTLRQDATIEPSAMFEQRVVARLSEQTQRRPLERSAIWRPAIWRPGVLRPGTWRSTPRDLAGAVAACLVAVCLVAVCPVAGVFLPHHRNTDTAHLAPSSTAVRALAADSTADRQTLAGTRTRPPSEVRIRTLVGTRINRPMRTALETRSTAVVQTQSLPKLDVFPSPSEPTEQTRELFVLAQSGQTEKAAPHSGPTVALKIEPITIAAIETKPLFPTPDHPAKQEGHKEMR